MTVQTPTISTTVTESKWWPLIALAVLLVSIVLINVSDNSFLLVPPVLVTLVSALRVSGNRWYLVPLIPAGLFVLVMFVAIPILWMTAS